MDSLNLPIAAGAVPANLSLEPSTPSTPSQGFDHLGLSSELLSALQSLGFTNPTAVQVKAIPMAMPPKDAGQTTDLLVSSQTGSGKTVAFLLPVLHRMLQARQQKALQEAQEWAQKLEQAQAEGVAPPKKPRRKNPTDPRHIKPAQPTALVLCPTRELAQQVAKDAIDLVRHCKGLRVACVVGGMPYPLQLARLHQADLVVATPGRLLDLQRAKQLHLNKINHLVVDEADRMLDLGFAEDLADIHALTETRQQTLMFSATIAPRIQQLATRIMRSPQRVQIEPTQAQKGHIQQILFWADHPRHKRQLLDHWLRDTQIDQAIVFASTQIECDELAVDLQQAGFSAVALHGALSQGLRNRRLQALRDGRVQILVATDVAARGIDVPTITHVFNFGLPMKQEDYVHRIGRTGRAGRAGLAVTFAEWRDRRKILDIEHYIKEPLKAEVVPGLEPVQRPTARPPRHDTRRKPSGGKGFAGARRGHGFKASARP